MMVSPTPLSFIFKLKCINLYLWAILYVPDCVAYIHNTIQSCPFTPVIYFLVIEIIEGT